MQMKAILKERLTMEFSFFECRKEIKRQSFSQFHWILSKQSRENSPNSAEVTELTSETYNSYWGYQDGKKRNARVKLSKS
jgi:hypothetical protein